MKLKTVGIPYLLLIALLSLNAMLKSQDIKTLEIDSQLPISPLLYEISGMCFYNDKIYALNDGGNGSYIFKLDIETGKLEEKYRIRDIRNKDWEELSIFGAYLYIGDFGNNSGKRSDMVIYRVKIDSLHYPDPPILTTGLEYLLKKKAKVRKSDNEWDCEAMTVNSDGIYCFSKNRKDLTTNLYYVREGINNILSPLASFDPGFLVTGAYYYGSGRSLFLCGYYNNETYLVQFKNTDGVSIAGRYDKYILPELKYTQVESVFVRGNYLYLASEKTAIRQAIYRISLSSLD
ncbi:MAG TPA: hypothetical protein ENH59_00135 [Bacteroidetes bacterium]|nr:hypothetical protein [Bacteroidota bacterium]